MQDLTPFYTELGAYGATNLALPRNLMRGMDYGKTAALFGVPLNAIVPFPRNSLEIQYEP